MIRHFVMLRVRPDVSDDARAQLLGELRGLAAHIDGLLDVQWRANISVEGDLTRDYTDMFWVDFCDAAARDAYLPHPEHQRVGALIVAALDGGIDGVCVCDVEI